MPISPSKPKVIDRRRVLDAPRRREILEDPVVREAREDARPGHHVVHALPQRGRNVRILGKDRHSPTRRHAGRRGQRRVLVDALQDLDVPGLVVGKVVLVVQERAVPLVGRAQSRPCLVQIDAAAADLRRADDRVAVAKSLGHTVDEMRDAARASRRERTRRNQPAGCDDSRAPVRRVEAPRHCGGAGLREQRPAVGAPVAPFVADDAVRVVVVDGADEVAPFADLRAGRELHLIVVVIVPVRHAGLDVGFGSLELGVEDEVHDAADGIRAVGRGTAAGHDLDALDQRRRQDGDVGACRLAVPGPTAGR